MTEMTEMTADILVNALTERGVEKAGDGAVLFGDLREKPEIGFCDKGIRYGIERIDGITPETDTRIAREIKRKKRAYKVNKIPVLWLFTPGREAVITDNRQLYLWEAEAAAANRTLEDREWELRASGHIRDASFFRLFGYEPDVAQERVLVNSVTEACILDGKPVFRTKRFLVDRKEAPIRVFLLWQSPWRSMLDMTLVGDGRFVFGEREDEEAAREAFDRNVHARQEAKKNS